MLREINEAFKTKSVSVKFNSVVEQSGDCINNTDNEDYTGKSKNANYKSYDVLGFKVAENSVNSGYNDTKYKKNENFNQFRKCLELVNY